MLKKCIAFAVVFAVAAGAAFAQVTLGGQLQEGMTLFSGSNVKDADVNMGGTYNSIYHEAKYSVLFGDGTAGGRLVLYGKGGFWGWMQWRPSQFFRVKIGSDGDGEGGFGQIVDWGFTGEAKNSVAAVNDYDGSLPMKYRNAGLNFGGAGGDANFVLLFSVFPTDFIQVNFLFNGFDTANEITERFATMDVYTSIKLEDIGTIRFAWEGKGGLAKDAPEGTNIGTLHLAFYSNELAEGVAFEVGGQYSLPKVDQSDSFDPITIGAGLDLTATDPFNLKFRGGVSLGGKKFGDDLNKTSFSIGLLPSYKLPKMTIYLQAGIGMELEKDKDAEYGWFVNPYISLPMGGMRMWLGLQIIDAHAALDGQINWNIPFGFNFYF